MVDNCFKPEEDSVIATAVPVLERKIAILGTTPSRLEAPLGDNSWEIWTIGPGGKDLHRWDRLYETHTVWPEEFSSYLNDLSQVKLPQQVRTLVPMKERIGHWAHRHGKDHKWLTDTIKGDWSANTVIDREFLYEKYRRMWFSTSIAYAVVEAIEDHAERGDRGIAKTTIGMFGIDLESDEEYISQHCGTAHFMDIARLVGIDLVMPKGCGLERDLAPYPDRYETHVALVYEKKQKLLTTLLADAETNRAKAQMFVHRIEGALLKVRELTNQGVITWKDDATRDTMLAAGDQELQRFAAEYQQVHNRCEQLKGERSATEYYQRMYVWTGLDPGKQA